MAVWRSRFLSISCVVLGLELHAAGRTYHKLAVSQLPTSQWTHVEVAALVTYVRYQDPKNGGDGDWHITLEQDGAKVVAEIIPLIPLTPPKKNQRCAVRGISRQDKNHGWPEIHPVEEISCK
jgi:hypothetical protein